MTNYTLRDPGPENGIGRMYARAGAGVWPIGGDRFLIGFRVYPLAHPRDPFDAPYHHPATLANDFHFYVASSTLCTPLVVGYDDVDHITDGDTWARARRSVTEPYQNRGTGEILLRLERRGLHSDPAPHRRASEYYSVTTGVVCADPDTALGSPAAHLSPADERLLLFESGRTIVPADRCQTIHRHGDIIVLAGAAAQSTPLWPALFPGVRVRRSELAVLRCGGSGDAVSQILTRYNLLQTVGDTVAACAVAGDGLTACAVVVTSAHDPRVVILDL